MQTAKNLKPFFLHYANAHRNIRTIRLRMAHGLAGYGLYIILLERLREEDNFELMLDYEALSFDLHCDPELLRSVVNDFGLFMLSPDGTRFNSAELTENMTSMLEAKQRKTGAARKAAEARWGKTIQTASTHPIEQPEPIAAVHCVSATATHVAQIEKSAPALQTKTEGNEARQNTQPPVADKLSAEIESMKTDVEWRRAICNEFGINALQLDSYLLMFRSNCISNGQKYGHQNFLDARRHCRHYIRKMRSIPEGKPVAPAAKREAEERKLREEQRRQEEEADSRREYEARRQNRQTGDNYFRNKGYEPGTCTMRQVSDPEWVRRNPPRHPEWIGRFTGAQTLASVFPD